LKLQNSFIYITFIAASLCCPFNHLSESL